MLRFERQVAQGDLLITRIDEIPTDAVAQQADNEGKFVLAHSETGHHHAITAPAGVVQLFGSSNPLVGYLRVQDRPVELKHHRAWDTHDSFEIKPGLYEIRRQRESTPEGWRRVED